MADYQLAHLDLSTRIKLVSQLLDPARPWGLVTELSKEQGVSRKFLYELREKAITSLSDALLPQTAGRKAHQNQVEIDDAFVRRAIAICMSVVPGTVRTVQVVLDWLLGVHRSVGYISQSAKEIGAQAHEYTQGLNIPILALAESR
jgi:hypothetical protein